MIEINSLSDCIIQNTAISCNIALYKNAKAYYNYCKTYEITQPEMYKKSLAEYQVQKENMNRLLKEIWISEFNKCKIRKAL